jgi:catechol 2,3-dioxygenase-like lactoylglutathione lyase family enzyme
MWRSMLDTATPSTPATWPGLQMEEETMAHREFAQYDGHYYAAFLRDPDGNKIEFATFAAD